MLIMYFFTLLCSYLFLYVWLSFLDSSKRFKTNFPEYNMQNDLQRKKNKKVKAHGHTTTTSAAELQKDW